MAGRVKKKSKKEDKWGRARAMICRKAQFANKEIEEEGRSCITNV